MQKVHGPIHQYLAEDHRRIEELLWMATARPELIDMEGYARFRAGLLRHIGMEEKILLPAVHKMNGGVALPMEGQIRLDHGAIAALLVPPPLPNVLNALRAILGLHDDREEQTNGLYELCDSIAVDQADELVEKLRGASAVRIAPNVDNPKVLDATRRALERAGYNFDDYV